MKNGLLPIVLSVADYKQLKNEIVASPQAEVKVDLNAQSIQFPSGKQASFPIDPFSKFCLLNGVDELEYLRRFTKQVEAYEAANAL